MDKFIDKISDIDKTKWYLPIILFILSTFLLTFRLNTTPRGYSTSELSTRSNLVDHLYTYHYLIHHFSTVLFSTYLVILNYIDLHNLTQIRFVGYLCGIFAIFLFFYIARVLTNKFIGSITTAMFATSLWFLQIVRNSLTLEFYSFAVLAFIFISVLYYRKKNLHRLAISLAILLGLSFYVPGMAWFGLLFLIINRKTLHLEAKLLSKKFKLSTLLIFLVILAPIVYESVSSHSLIRSTLLIPSSFHPHLILTQLLDYPKNLFIQNNSQLRFSTGRLPMVHFASAILLIFSGIWFYRNWKNPITSYISYSLIIGWILVALNGSKAIYIIMPLISLLVSIGIFYLYKEWKRVFPRNPYPDFVANLLISLLVAGICFYQILLYFIVWPHTTQVLSIYSHYL
jgi:hypothetical protein